MSPASTGPCKRTIRSLVYCGAMTISGGFGAAAQQTDQLQAQLQQLKQQYAETSRSLEERIAALEAEIERQRTKAAPSEGTISAAELAKEAVHKATEAQSGQVGAQYQGQLPSAPTYDLLKEADQKIAKLEQTANSFEFHGYFRS